MILQKYKLVCDFCKESTEVEAPAGCSDTENVDILIEESKGKFHGVYSQHRAVVIKASKMNVGLIGKFIGAVPVYMEWRDVLLLLCGNCADLVRRRHAVKSDDDLLTSEEFDKLKQYNFEYYCHCDNDGMCDWECCPQNRDGEPEKSNRSCPLPPGPYTMHGLRELYEGREEDPDEPGN